MNASASKSYVFIFSLPDKKLFSSFGTRRYIYIDIYRLQRA